MAPESAFLTLMVASQEPVQSPSYCPNRCAGVVTSMGGNMRFRRPGGDVLVAFCEHSCVLTPSSFVMLVEIQIQFHLYTELYSS